MGTYNMCEGCGQVTKNGNNTCNCEHDREQVLKNKLKTATFLLRVDNDTTFQQINLEYDPPTTINHWQLMTGERIVTYKNDRHILQEMPYERFMNLEQVIKNEEIDRLNQLEHNLNQLQSLFKEFQPEYKLIVMINVLRQNIYDDLYKTEDHEIRRICQLFHDSNFKDDNHLSPIQFQADVDKYIKQTDSNHIWYPFTNIYRCPFNSTTSCQLVQLQKILNLHLNVDVNYNDSPFQLKLYTDAKTLIEICQSLSQLGCYNVDANNNFYCIIDNIIKSKTQELLNFRTGKSSYTPYWIWTP